MQLVINGEIKTVDNTDSLEVLAKGLGLDTKKVAIELNSAIIPKSMHASQKIAEGDKIEIFSFIGGG